MVKKVKQNINLLEGFSVKATNWIGTPYSIIVHTLFFIGIFILGIFGVSIDKILLILTTAVSLEAIYLAIFIQMTVNRHSVSLESVEDDIEDIQEDMKDLEGGMEDISEEVEEISEDLDNMQDKAHNLKEHPDADTLDQLEKVIAKIQKDLYLLRKNRHTKNSTLTDL